MPNQEILIDHTPYQIQITTHQNCPIELDYAPEAIIHTQARTVFLAPDQHTMFVCQNDATPFEISTTENHSQVTFSEKLTDALKTQKIQHQKIIFESSKHLDSAHPEDMIITSHTSAALFSTILKNLTITWPTGHIDSSKLANLAHILKMAQAYPDTILINIQDLTDEFRHVAKQTN